jgi:AcrR family transcriptional regulator
MMDTGRLDRRAKRTHKLLQEALIALTLEKGYESITIRDITDRADVGYATYFRHYPDKQALLTAVLESMRDEFVEMLEPLAIVHAPERTGQLIFEYVAQNRDLCLVLLNSTDIMSLIRPMQEIGWQESGPILEASGSGAIPADLAVSHMMSSLVMMVRWWLENDMRYPPEQMGRIAAALIIRPVTGVLPG